VTGQSATLAEGFNNATTEALKSPRSKWFPRIVAVAAVLGLLAGGATVRLLRHRLQAKEPMPEPVAEKSQPIVTEQEPYLLESTRQWADPTSDTRDLKRGLDCQIDLFIYYMKHQRLDDADAFCKELTSHKYKPMPSEVKYPHPYPAFGELGQALVMTFRDQPQAVDQMAKLIRVNPPRPALNLPGGFSIAGLPGQFLEHAELRRLMIEALNRLAMDQKDRFKQYSQLDGLRKLLTMPRPPNGKP